MIRKKGVERWNNFLQKDKCVTNSSTLLMSDMYEIEVKIEAATIQNWFMTGAFTNYYVEKKRWVGSPKIMTFCQRLLGRKFQRRGVGGQKNGKFL